MSEFLPADPGVHEHHQGPETIVDGMEHSDDVHFNAAGVGLAFLGLKSYLEKGPRGSSRSLDQVPRHLSPSEQRRVDELKAQGKDPELETQMRYTREAIERGSSVDLIPDWLARGILKVKLRRMERKQQKHLAHSSTESGSEPKT